MKTPAQPLMFNVLREVRNLQICVISNSFLEVANLNSIPLETWSEVNIDDACIYLLSPLRKVWGHLLKLCALLATLTGNNSYIELFNLSSRRFPAFR